MASIDRPFESSFSAGRFGAAKGRFPAVDTPAPQPQEIPRDRLRDLTALALLAGCVFLVGSLATYDSADPPGARAFPPHARAVNACGLIGAAVAGGLYEWLGLGAWFAVALVVGLDVALLRRRPLPDLPLRAVGGVLAASGLCTLLAMFLPNWCTRPVWGPGGCLGALGRHLAEGYLATTGAAIVVAGLTAAGLFLACDAFLVALGGACLSAVAALDAAIRSGWRSVGSRIGSDPGAESREGQSLESRLGLRLRGTAPAEDADDAEHEDEDGPTIKVRRREIESAEPDDDSSFEVEADAEDGDDSAVSDCSDADDALPVPIRSLASRRKPASVLEMAPDPTAEYELPSIDLLLPAEQLQLEAQEQEVRERAKVLEKTFADFGFKVRVVEIETGPVISQYEIELEAGLRLAKIANLADDLAIALRVPSVRIVAPIPGKNSVGIEVPNTDRQMVRLREVIEETQAKSRTMKIPIFLGKDVAGNPMVVDMASMPHLLIAGRTGTGKSVCLNSLIVSMLMTRRPDEVRMLMIDPKMVELTPYKSLPHLMHPVVTDMKKAEA
ncbi:MAG: DNA translocase FtsK, partial [Planctomycetia bacterium]|nr:DNA translocase FtsK [Planctomycetia bacterium]